MGMSRDTFNPATYIKKGQTTQQMHYSCYSVLTELIAKVTGDKMFSVLREPPNRAVDYLHIDPVGVLMMNNVNTTAVTTIEMIVNYSIQLPARFTEKLTKSHATARPARHTQALHHLSVADYLVLGQTSIRDQKRWRQSQDQRSPRVLHQAEAMPTDGLTRLTAAVLQQIVNVSESATGKTVPSGELPRECQCPRAQPTLVTPASSM